MSSVHILQFPRADNDEGFVLIQVTCAGSKSLDLKLVGTEGEEPYMVKLRHDRTAGFKVKNCPCSQDEWESILVSVLLDRQVPEDVETAASVESQSSITISFRKRIQGITQRLGTLSLSYKEDEAIELFDWCGESIRARETVKEDLATASAKSQELEKAVAGLKSQLDELITAKQRDESELLEKFRDLLNEKKVKIREQQRMLAAGKVARRAGVLKDEMKDDDQPSASMPVIKSSQATKRKAAQAVRDSESDSDDGYEEMDVDKPRAAMRGEDVSEDQQTTDRDDDATASEADGDELSKNTTSHGLAVAQQSSKFPSKDQVGLNTGPKSKAPSTEELPPKRELPFALDKGKQPTTSEQVPAIARGSETESDDDEL